MRKTKEQLRASHAWSAILQIRRYDDARKKKLGNAIKELPVRIQSSGLGQALAFLNAKKHAPELEKILVHWLMNDQPSEYFEDPRCGSQQLIEQIIQGSSAKLRKLTDEALAYLPWLSRFAEGAGMMEGEIQ